MIDNEEQRENDYILQSLADRDINAKIMGGKVYVHRTNFLAAKNHLSKIGYGDKEVIHESEEMEDLDEASAELKGKTTKHVESHAAAHGWKPVDGTKHAKWIHPDHPLPLMIPRHKGDLPIGTLKQLKKRIERQDLHLVKHFRGRGKNECVLLSFKEFLSAVNEMAHLESEQVVEIDESVEQPEEFLLEDFDDRLAGHIRGLRDSGHNVVITAKGKDGKSATFTSSKDGRVRKHTLTLRGLVHHDTRDPSNDVEEKEKRGRGRPAGSKNSGASARK